ncbi:hemolysin XhlA family protein [Bacillus toyonensis]|uniref:hemolysin XhlA family protein n=1 Tax=Bacillus toyonensis TaxID=155322 RepID=UPI0005345960|nr:hemolysin XhlA family protein [Bacillus toyonensis]
MKQDISRLKEDQKDMQREIRILETRTTVNEREIMNINKTLEKISSNTTWILRLVVGAIVTALIGLLIKGG